MELKYTVWDPTKNITLLVSTPVERSAQAETAARLMAARPQVEQVGFLEPAAAPGAELRLQMMGGEFCGNASMSAAAELAQRTGGGARTVPLEVSGYPGVLSVRLSPRADGGWDGTVAMPLPRTVGAAEIPGAGRVPAVTFDGITHCIVPAGRLTRPQAEAAVRPLCAALGADACGILLYDEPAGAFAPLVFVASTGTAVWESGCGSGTAAVAAVLAARAQADRTVRLRQPGGTIAAHAEWAGGRVAALSITGRTALVERGRCAL